MALTYNYKDITRVKYNDKPVKTVKYNGVVVFKDGTVVRYVLQDLTVHAHPQWQYVGVVIINIEDTSKLKGTITLDFNAQGGHYYGSKGALFEEKKYQLKVSASNLQAQKVWQSAQIWGTGDTRQEGLGVGELVFSSSTEVVKVTINRDANNARVKEYDGGPVKPDTYKDSTISITA